MPRFGPCILRLGSLVASITPGSWLPRLNSLIPGSVPRYLSSVPGTGLIHCYLEVYPNYAGWIPGYVVVVWAVWVV